MAAVFRSLFTAADTAYPNRATYRLRALYLALTTMLINRTHGIAPRVVVINRILRVHGQKVLAVSQLGGT